jgi:CheY-like chemotaxis protein
MRLERISVDQLRRALEIYLEIAWEGQPEKQGLPLALEGKATVAEILPEFGNEGHAGGSLSAHRHILRLGSRLYPFMKFVLQEYLFEGEYFFQVDTHDQMDIKPSVPDYEAWVELKRKNLRLKESIERSWRRAEIPTLADLAKTIETVPHVQGDEKSGAILIVDDERPIADTIGALLERRGYEVRKAYDGAEGLEVMATFLPDVVLLDYEMPKIDGCEVTARIKSEERFKNVRVLLSTAGSVSLDRAGLADGFLVKPYRTEILFKVVAHLVESGS